MARNKEKQLGRLNRLVLKELHDEEEKQNPKRPHLTTLTTASELKHWLPSIKKDLDFYLKQSEVPCYPVRVIDEFSDRINRLKGEYKAYVSKLKCLDPDFKNVPLSERVYESRPGKRSGVISEDESPATKKTKSKLSNFPEIKLPILSSSSEEVYKSANALQTTEPSWNVIIATESDDNITGASEKANESEESHSCQLPASQQQRQEGQLALTFGNTNQLDFQDTDTNGGLKSKRESNETLVQCAIETDCTAQNRLSPALDNDTGRASPSNVGQNNQPLLFSWDSKSVAQRENVNYSKVSNSNDANYQDSMLLSLGGKQNCSSDIRTCPESKVRKCGTSVPKESNVLGLDYGSSDDSEVES